ncbi:heterokaryon incompatibility protein-domain-containing protein [Pyrenochaeta sp. MPI-SDFR-AT-0127]|nr:heterokaryon incompatibility protein-domain-containing protein [Pyrenochaeta sp. MPI-SDFR-AT-0127]
MHLLQLDNTGEFSLVEFVGSNIPRYAILSHTWGADHEEVTIKDIVKGTGKDKAGYAKIRFCGKQAAKDNFQYFWVDTCCINKSSSAELSEAINSMFRWYHNAARCYVYLSDVSTRGSDGNDLSSQRTWKTAFQHSRWFTRGWTLQELLAPTSIEFFSAEGERLGDRNSLMQEIHDITGISIQALKGGPLSQFSINERVSWAKRRETKREEDAAYSLLGIFNVHMPLIYGEGRKKAFSRLQRETEQFLRDESTVPPSAPSIEGPKRNREPFSTVPVARCPDFMDRCNFSAWICEKCAVPMTYAAIVSPGDVGASQLAIKHENEARAVLPHGQSLANWRISVFRSPWPRSSSFERLASTPPMLATYIMQSHGPVLIMPPSKDEEDNGNGDGEGDNPIWDPRVYFLTILKTRIDEIVEDWTNLVRNLEEGVEQRIEKHPIVHLNSTTNGLDHVKSNIDWTVLIMALLRKCRGKLSSIIRAWDRAFEPDRFNTSDISIFYPFESSEPQVKAKAKLLWNETNKSFDKTRNIENTLNSLYMSCEEYSKILIVSMNLESSRLNLECHAINYRNLSLNQTAQLTNLTAGLILSVSLICGLMGARQPWS